MLIVVKNRKTQREAEVVQELFKKFKMYLRYFDREIPQK